MDATNRISPLFRLQASRSQLARALVEAMATLLAAIATLLCVLAISPEPGSGVLAVVLCLSLSRSQLDRDRRGRIEAFFVLPAVGLAAAGIGMLLLRFPIVGAVVFTAGMFMSIWLRRFGPLARRIGSLMALPFVTLLTVPYIPPRHPGLVPPFLLPIVIALLALFWVNVVHMLAQGFGLLKPVKLPVAAPAPPAESTLRPIASTRMAIQMALALGLSFAIGYVVFPQHWAWVVLTAFIVNSGNRGRLDVAHKSVLRVLGAAAGTVMAGLISIHLGIGRSAMVILMLTMIFLGVWLRLISYGWWALFVTVVLALLQDFVGVSASHMMWSRLEEIAVGAVIGVTVAWFVLPVRSTGTLRRRIADALAALATALDRQQPTRTPDAFFNAMHAVEQIAPAFRASRHIARYVRPHRPYDWIEVLLDCREAAGKLIEQGRAPAAVHQALGQARRSLREPETILPALQQLRASLHEACAEPKTAALA
ncbi:FUSC family protein [Dyella nitratireducens]|uniref:FUSC family protein n=1 Tax=Dyella nitratireducens TaxID=1849580 RepID=A0ABQ1FUW0_9GAMM|nr:FUSC family protein [Dyella nitratireducens]GGA30492.1 FUSC family protein [Dyella nitratireducens]GLQ42999.1 FUSC family protein [Dyella nitratireducens]